MWRLALATRMAWRSLAAHRLRTALAVLGVVIGVGAVIMLTAMGEGAERRVTSRVTNLGVNLMFVYPVSTPGAHGLSRRTAETLTVEDARSIRQLPGVAETAPEIRLRDLPVAYENRSEQADQVVGTWPSYRVLRAYQVAAGRFLDEADAAGGTRVCVLGSALARRLFGWNDPLGKWIRIGTRREHFKVVGVMAERGAEAAWLRFDEFVYIPIAAMQKFFMTGRRHVDQLSVMAEQTDQVEAVGAAVAAHLKRRHGIPARRENDVMVYSQLQMQQTAAEVAGAFTQLMGGIAVVSLLVGGIGIMNVMIVTVMERTREIGVRKAIGAARADILQQFMLESFLISFVGGLLGIALGVAGARILPMLPQWEQMMPRAGGAWEAHISPTYVLLAFGCACAVGLFFGIYPALKASRLNPVEALRYE